MKSHLISNWKTFVVCAALSFMAVAVFLPATVSAVNSGQVDVCAGGTNCNNFIIDYVNPLIVVLTAMVGIAAVISIIIAGIQYSASADDPGMVTKAKQRIFNTVLGLVAYIFLLAFLNYLVPGGIPFI